MEKIKSTKDSRFRSFLMSALRRASRFWSPARECLGRARIARGMYKCENCSKVVGTKEIKIDHIDPVIPISGFEKWDEVIERLFCEEDGFQAICKECHDIKTKKENSDRKALRKEKAVLKSYKKRTRKSQE
jgi:5-methylcytosine-specific restriction endonuclease McrA